MSRVVVAPLARSDLDAIWDHIGIKNGNPAAAQRLVDLLNARFQMLAAHPLLGEYRSDLADLIQDVRSFSVGSYVIYYQPIPDGVRIGRILHGARDVRKALTGG